MNEEDRQPVSNFPAVAARHALQFLGNVFEIETLDIPAPRAPSLVLQPGDEIVFIGGRIPRSCHRLIPILPLSSVVSAEAVSRGQVPRLERRGSGPGRHEGEGSYG